MVVVVLESVVLVEMGVEAVELVVEYAGVKLSEKFVGMELIEGYVEVKFAAKFVASVQGVVVVISAELIHFLIRLVLVLNSLTMVPDPALAVSSGLPSCLVSNQQLPF